MDYAWFFILALPSSHLVCKVKLKQKHHYWMLNKKQQKIFKITYTNFPTVLILALTYHHKFTNHFVSKEIRGRLVGDMIAIFCSLYFQKISMPYFCLFSCGNKIIVAKAVWIFRSVNKAQILIIMFEYYGIKNFVKWPIRQESDFLWFIFPFLFLIQIYIHFKTIE